MLLPLMVLHLASGQRLGIHRRAGPAQCRSPGPLQGQLAQLRVPGSCALSPSPAQVWVKSQFGGVREAFKAIDSDHTRFITHTEFTAALQRFGFQRPTKQLPSVQQISKASVEASCGEAGRAEALQPAGQRWEQQDRWALRNLRTPGHATRAIRAWRRVVLGRSGLDIEVIDDLLFLDSWNPLPFLVVAPNFKALTNPSELAPMCLGPVECSYGAGNGRNQEVDPRADRAVHESLASGPGFQEGRRGLGPDTVWSKAPAPGQGCDEPPRTWQSGSRN